MKTSSAINPMLQIFSLRDFRLLFLGSTTSLLGDQFTLIATPWLTLQMTHDPLALGIVLALEGIPRAIFMLLGGAVTDRVSPRLVMLISDIVRMVLTALMAVAVFTNSVQIWMLYTFALLFGLVAGFAVPASSTIIPMIVSNNELQAGNSLMMSISQLIGFVGPTLAGILIGSFADSAFGIILAFSIDSFTYSVSALCLWLLRSGSKNKDTQESVWAAIGTGIKYLWQNQVLRLMFLILMALNFLLIGPLLVGMPVMANLRLAEGAAAYGLLMSAFAGGNLAGCILAGVLPKPSGKILKAIMVALLAGFSFVVGVFGFITSTWLDFALLLMLGLGNGYVSILMFTWIQLKTPREILGRMMSILLFFSTGLVPISQAISGALIKWNLEALFVIAGTLSLMVTIWAAYQPGMRTFSDSLAQESSQESPQNQLRVEMEN